MPSLTPVRQPEADLRWYRGAAGQAVIASELPGLHAALSARPGLPWLVLSAVARPAMIGLPHGLWLRPQARGWRGELRCGAALPLASESVGVIVLQHVQGDAIDACLAECARVLVPGGRLSVFALNPLSPYRRHWLGERLSGREPVTWRRRLKRAGLSPDAVAEGVGPRWRRQIDAQRQLGAGARAAYLLSAEKRRIPLTPRRKPSFGPALADPA